MKATSGSALRMADKCVASSNRLVGSPGAGATQTAMMQAAAGFTIAAAIFDLAAAVREKGSGS